MTHSTLEFKLSTLALNIAQQVLCGEKETSGIDMFSIQLERTEECPICLDLLPYAQDECIMCHICGKSTCSTCSSEMKRTGFSLLCGLCNTDIPKYKEVFEEQAKKGLTNLFRKHHHPSAANTLGNHHRSGGEGYSQSYAKSLYYYLHAARWGDPAGYYNLGRAYGYGVEGYLPKDLNMCNRSMIVAAKMGDLYAHRDLFDKVCDNDDEQSRNCAISHAKILAKMGCRESMQYLFLQYQKGYIVKDELTYILREHGENM